MSINIQTLYYTIIVVNVQVLYHITLYYITLWYITMFLL